MLELKLSLTGRRSVEPFERLYEVRVVVVVLILAIVSLSSLVSLRLLKQYKMNPRIFLPLFEDEHLQEDDVEDVVVHAAVVVDELQAKGRQVAQSNL